MGAGECLVWGLGAGFLRQMQYHSPKLWQPPSGRGRGVGGGASFALEDGVGGKDWGSPSQPVWGRQSALVMICGVSSF